MSSRYKALKNAKYYHDISSFNASMLQVKTNKILAYTFCGSREQGERLTSCKKETNHNVLVPNIIWEYHKTVWWIL